MFFVVVVLVVYLFTERWEQLASGTDMKVSAQNPLMWRASPDA